MTCGKPKSACQSVVSAGCALVPSPPDSWAWRWDMIRTLVGADRHREPELFDQMYRARAAMFHDRLRWKVRVRHGWEIDRYDEAEDPVYLVAVGLNGRLTGSLRL